MGDTAEMNGCPKYTFLFRGEGMSSGGDVAQMKLMRAVGMLRDVEAVTYLGHHEDYRTLRSVVHGDQTFVVHWGPDAPALFDQLKQRRVVYTAYSAGWGRGVPSHVPILAASRNTLAFWGRRAPNNFLALVPAIVDIGITPAADGERDVDVLVRGRKTSPYVLDILVPGLRKQGLRVEVISDRVPDLHALLRRSKVYLHDSVEHWLRMNVTEGFGLPPLEAIACGCTVFSSINDALADYLDPGMNCHKIRVHSVEYDVARIVGAVRNRGEGAPDLGWIAGYSTTSAVNRLRIILPELEGFLAMPAAGPGDIPAVG